MLRSGLSSALAPAVGATDATGSQRLPVATGAGRDCRGALCRAADPDCG